MSNRIDQKFATLEKEKKKATKPRSLTYIAMDRHYNKGETPQSCVKYPGR